MLFTVGFGSLFWYTFSISWGVQSDEGFEILKANLLRKHPMYSSIWWDQPPMHPSILQAGATLFGSGLQSFRLVAGLLCAASLGALVACASPFGVVAAVCDRRASSAGSAGGSAVADRRYRGGGSSAFLAPFAVILLCLSSVSFLSYGLSVTIMLPALGFGLGAVWLWQRFGLSGNRWVLFGSGLVFGLGFQTKFTVLLFLPALAVEFLKQAWATSVVGPRCARPWLPSEGEAARSAALPGAWEKILRALGFLFQWSGIWVAGFAYGVALVWAFFPEEDLIWLLKYHFRPEVTGAFQGQAGLSPMLNKLGLDWPIAGFAGLGLILGIVQRRWAAVFPTVFFLTSFAAHAWHRPWWDYYYLHLSIPMAWLGALGVQWTWDCLTGNREWRMGNRESVSVAALCERRAAGTMGEQDSGHRPPLQGWRLREFWPGWKPAGLIAAFSFCLAGLLVDWPERYERETAFLRVKPSETELKVLAALKERRADTRWLYTDRPIWCAHANILIPPELAVLSLKRIAAGDITHAEFLRLLYHYRPEQIVLQRRHFEDEKFHEFLRAFYEVVIEEGNLKYLVRRDWEAARKRKATSLLGMQNLEFGIESVHLPAFAAQAGGQAE